MRVTILGQPMFHMLRHWRVLALLALVCLGEGARADVRIVPYAGGYQITTPIYTAVLGEDGCLHSLCVDGHDFLDDTVFTLRGLSLFTDRPVTLATLEHDGGDSITARDDATSLLYQFADGYISLTAHHALSEGASLVAVCAPGVAFVEDLSRPDHIVSAPTDAAWPHVRLSVPAGAYLELHGGTRLWGGGLEGRQVWEAANLTPQQPQSFTLIPGVGSPKAPDPARLTTLTLAAADDRVTLAAGEPCAVRATLTNAGTTAVAGTMTLQTTDTRGEDVTTTAMPFACPPGAATTVDWSLTFPQPEVYTLTATATIGTTPVTATTAVAYIPEALAPSGQLPDDYAAYWDALCATPGAVIPTPDIVPNPGRSNPTVAVALVRLTLPDATWSGWLTTPTAPGRYPGILVLGSGATRYLLPDTGLAQCGFVVLVMEPSGQAVDGRLEAGHARAMRDLHDPQRAGLRAMLLNGMTALRVLAARPEVDPARVGVTGVGLGGSVALLLAAHAPGVAAVAADVPLGCDMALGREQATWPYPAVNDFMAEHPEDGDAVWTTLDYFNVAHAANRITAPALVSAGLRDPFVRPRAVIAMTNRLAGPRDLRLYQAGHEGGGAEHWRVKLHWLRAQLGDPQLEERR